MKNKDLQKAMLKKTVVVNIAVNEVERKAAVIVSLDFLDEFKQILKDGAHFRKCGVVFNTDVVKHAEPGMK